MSETQQIKELTPELWAEIEKVKQQMIDLETTPLVKSDAEYWIMELYREINYYDPETQLPKPIFWFKSPFATTLGVEFHSRYLDTLKAMDEAEFLPLVEEAKAEYKKIFGVEPLKSASVHPDMLMRIFGRPDWKSFRDKSVVKQLKAEIGKVQSLKLK